MNVIGRSPKDGRLRRETLGFPLFVYRLLPEGGEPKFPPDTPFLRMCTAQANSL